MRPSGALLAPAASLAEPGVADVRSVRAHLGPQAGDGLAVQLAHA